MTYEHTAHEGLRGDKSMRCRDGTGNGCRHSQALDQTAIYYNDGRTLHPEYIHDARHSTSEVNVHYSRTKDLIYYLHVEACLGIV